MMFPRLGLMNKNQRGFTLLEIILAMTIGSLIIASITTAIFQVFIGNARTSSHMTAVRQVQNAGYWVSHDAQMAQTVVPNWWNVTGFPLTLSWTDWGGTSYNATYTIDTASGELRRRLLQNGSQTSTTAVARYIDPNTTKTKCRLSGGGTFNLPDSGDAFTISGGAVADSGKITVATGSISSVTTAGGATYNTTSGTWTTPAGGGTVTVSRATSGVAATGTWTSAAASATVAITTDADRDATITGGTLVFTVTATVGTGSQQQTETRVYDVTPRPSS